MPFGTNRHTGVPGALYRPGRRDFLRTLGLAGAAGIAGCSDIAPRSSGDGGRDGGGDDGSVAEGGTAGGGERTVEGRYISATSTDAQSLNWLTTADTTSGSYVGTALDGTWVITPEQEIFPLWADISSDDGRVYEVELRDGLRWGAGYGRMTAEDWVYMITELFQAPENWSGYPSADDWFGTNPQSGNREPIPVERTGELTFEVRLFEIDPSFPFQPVLWGQTCAPKGLLEKYVPNRDTQGLQQDRELNTLAYAGNLGPYTYENWERESQYVATRNEDYYMREAENVPEAWTGAPYFEEFVFRVIKEESARLGALESGSVTSAGIPPNKAERFDRLEDVAVNVSPQPFVTILAYNMRANGWEPFRRKSVRQALAHAVDKEAIAGSIYRGYAQVAQTMQPRWSKWYDGNEVVEYGVADRYGPEVTRRQLGDALADTEYGYDGDVLRNGRGEQVGLTLFFDQGQPTEQTLAEFVAQEFEQNAGIRVQIRTTSSFIEKFAHNTPPEGVTPEWSAGYFNGGPRDVSTSAEPWDMSVSLGFNTYPYTPAASKAFFETRGGINFYGYRPEADIAGLYEQASSTTDEAERKRLFGEAFGLISREQPFGFLTMTSSISGYQAGLSGPIEDFANGWDSVTWYFE